MLGLGLTLHGHHGCFSCFLPGCPQCPVTQVLPNHQVALLTLRTDPPNTLALHSIPQRPHAIFLVLAPPGLACPCRGRAPEAAMAFSRQKQGSPLGTGSVLWPFFPA